MSVDKHPSRKPALPRKPPATSTTDGHKNVMHSGSGQAGVPYGFRHEVNVKPSHKSEMKHHFEDSGALPGHVGRPGIEKANDEPG